MRSNVNFSHNYAVLQMGYILLHISALKVFNICMQYGTSGRNPVLYDHLFD